MDRLPGYSLLMSSQAKHRHDGHRSGARERGMTNGLADRKIETMGAHGNAPSINDAILNVALRKRL
jgi:hypothetical protein